MEPFAQQAAEFVMRVSEASKLDRTEIGDTLMAYIAADAMKLGVEPAEVIAILTECYETIDWEDLRQSLVIGAMELAA